MTTDLIAMAISFQLLFIEGSTKVCHEAELVSVDACDINFTAIISVMQ
jgi:hypothetical protein